MEEDSKISNQKALEKLRDLFSDYVDLEQEIYQTFESHLNSFGVKLGFYFPKEVKIDFNDFFSKYNLWQIFCGSVNLPDIFFMDLRMQMSRPWFLSRDFFDVEIIVGSQRIKFKSEQNLNNHFLDLQQLLSKIFLFNQYPITADGEIDNLSLAKEFKQTKYFIIKLIRVKKEESGFRKYLESENCLISSEDYREKLEKILQATVKETLANLDVTEDVIRMHLQERLALWGYRFSKILNEEELINQYSIVKIGNIFPSLLDGALFIQSLTYNSNDEVINAIKNNKYKNILNRFLSRLENQKILLMKFNGINLENNPEFLLNIKAD